MKFPHEINRLQGFCWSFILSNCSVMGKEIWTINGSILTKCKGYDLWHNTDKV